MSTVTPTNTLIVPSFDVSGPSAAPTPTPGTASTTSTPNTATLPASMRLDLGFQGLSAATLGIRVPSSPEDTAAILAEVAQLLNETVDKARDKRAELLANALRSLLGDVGGLSEGIAQHREEYNRLSAERDVKLSERDALVVQRDALVAQRNSKVSERNALSGQATALSTQIGLLNTQIAIVNAAGGDASGLIATRNGFQSQLDSANARIGTLNGEIGALNTRIDQFNAQINQLNSEIAVLEGKMDVEKAAYEALEVLRDILMNVFAQYALTIAGRENLGLLEDTNWDKDLDRVFENLAAALKQVQATLSDAVEEFNPLDAILLKQMQDGNADATSDRTLAATALALATAVAQVVAVLGGLDQMPDDAKGGADDGLRLRLAV